MLLDVIYIPIIIMLGLGFINVFRSDISDYDEVMLKRLFFYHLLMGVYNFFFIF